jgi:hypothetical protein
MREMNPNEVRSPYESPTASNGSALTLRPTRAMAVFIQLGLTWTPLLWTAVKASGYGGRAFVIGNPTFFSALLCFLSTILIAQRWKVRIPRLAILVAGVLIFALISVGDLLPVTVFDDPDRTVLTFFLEPQSVRVSLAIILFSSPATVWLLTVREPKDDSIQV